MSKPSRDFFFFLKLATTHPHPTPETVGDETVGDETVEDETVEDETVGDERGVEPIARTARVSKPSRDFLFFSQISNNPPPPHPRNRRG